MIANIKGIITGVDEDSLVVSLGNIAFSVLVPMTRLNPRPVVGEEIFLYTHLQIREDAWTLFGFANNDQLRIFRQLLGVSGVGAKTALAIIDAISIPNFIRAVSGQDLKTFTNVSGVGKKTAERIILELKDKFKDLTINEDSGTLVAAEVTKTDELDHDLLAALKQLGYTATEARAFALQAQADLGPDASPEKLLRAALKIARDA